MLDHAALLGRRFDSVLLALATKTSVDTLIAALKRSCDSGIITAEDTDGYRWKFKHAIIHQSFVDAIPAARKQEYHATILDALEIMPDLEPRLDQLAYHARESGYEEKVVLYNERAGDTAFRMCAFADAERYYAVALPAAGHSAANVRLFKKLLAAQGHTRAPT